MPNTMPTDELTPEQRASLKTDREVIEDILALPALDDGSILMLPGEVQALRERLAATAPVPQRVGDAFYHGWLLKTYPNGDVLVSAPNYEPAAMMINTQEVLDMIANINKAMDEDGDIKAVGMSLQEAANLSLQTSMLIKLTRCIVSQFAHDSDAAAQAFFNSNKRLSSEAAVSNAQP